MRSLTGAVVRKVQELAYEIERSIWGTEMLVSCLVDLN